MRDLRKQDGYIPNYLALLLEEKFIKFTVDFGSTYYGAITALGKNHNKYFHNLSIEDQDGYMVFRASFSDLIRLFLVERWNREGWAPKKIKRALLLVKFDELHYLSYKGKPLDEKALNHYTDKYQYLIEYFSEPSFKTVFFDLPMEGGPKENKRVIALYKKLEKDFKLKSFYKVNYDFERVIFDMINYQSSYFLGLEYKKGSIKSIFFSNKYNLLSHLSGLSHIELYRLTTVLFSFAFTSGDPIFKKIGSLIDKDIEPESKRIETKMQFCHRMGDHYISLLDSIEKLDPSAKNYESLCKERDQHESLLTKIWNEIELKDFHMYDYLGSTDNVISDMSEMSSIKNSKALWDHMKNVVSGMITAEIDRGSVKSVQVYKKEFSKSQADLRSEYPYAEIGGQQHNGKHKFSTVRYKKDIE